VDIGGERQRPVGQVYLLSIMDLFFSLFALPPSIHFDCYQTDSGLGTVSLSLVFSDWTTGQFYAHCHILSGTNVFIFILL